MATIISSLEIILFCLGATLFVYRPEIRISEALSSGIILAFLALSFIFQAVFLIGQPNLAFFLEGLLLVWLVLKVRKKAKYLGIFYQRIKCFSTQHKFFTILISLVWIYLGLQAMILPPSNWDSMAYNLARVLLFQQEKSLLLTNVAGIWQSIFPVGADILHHIFLRFYTDYGIGIFSFLSYLSVALGTYALSRRYTSTETSLVSTLVIISLPELVYQATSTKNDIIVSALAIFCFLTVHRLLNQANLKDLITLMLALIWGISVKTTWLAFILPFSLFFGIVLLQKYPAKIWVPIIFQNWRRWIPFVVPALIFSQFWLFIHNYYFWGTWSGTPEYNSLSRQVDGLKGSVANLVRYLLQSIDLLEPGNIIVRRLIGISFTELLQKIYDTFLYPIFGDAATNEILGPFQLSWWSHEDMAWFGPLGFLLVIPAVLYSIIKGKKVLRASGLTLLGYICILSYALAWNPFHNRYVSLFFVASGGCVAYLINSFGQRRLLVKLVKYTSILILLIACSINAAKPLISLDQNTYIGSNINVFNLPYVIFQKSIWGKTRLGTNRFYYADNFYGDSRVKEFMKLVPPGSQVALVTEGHLASIWVYHYFLHNPQVKFTPVLEPQLESKSLKFDYILCAEFQCKFNQTNSNGTILWAAKPSAKKGQLIRVSESLPEKKK
ncbi:MAG: glycosyltransferase family 39 protein [Phormidium sp.]